MSASAGGSAARAEAKRASCAFRAEPRREPSRRSPTEARETRQSKVAHAARPPSPAPASSSSKTCRCPSIGGSGRRLRRSRAGWTVSVICPTNPTYPKLFEVIDDIAIYRHPLPPEGRGGARLLARIFGRALPRIPAPVQGAPRARLFGHPGLQSAGPHLPRRSAVQAHGQDVHLRPARRLRRNCSSSNSASKGPSPSRADVSSSG